jgi:hypothetical protein
MVDRSNDGSVIASIALANPPLEPMLNLDLIPCLVPSDLAAKRTSDSSALVDETKSSGGELCGFY